MNQYLIFRDTAFCACLLALLVTSPLVSAPALGDQVIEEIVVTARKRNENLQDVPAAVSAFNAVELEERGIDNLIEIGRLTPNITVNETTGIAAGAMQVYIRGIGYEAGYDPGVGVYVDDVYLSRPSGALIDVYDIERIEVLKGPQGHLYGRNTIGGTIKYVSAEPDDEMRIRTSAKVGTDDQRNFKASISGPLAEEALWGSVAVSQVGHDGYQTNVWNGGEYASPDILSARGTLVAQLGESLRVKLVADLMRDRSDPYVPTRVALNLDDPTGGLRASQGLLSGANQLPFLFPGAALLPPGVLLDTHISSDVDEVNSAHVKDGFDEYFIDTNRLSLTATWDFAEAWSLKSVTGVQETKRTQPSDFDGSDQLFINTLGRWDWDDFSQELQINYTGERINALLGFYYLDHEYRTTTFTQQRALLRLFVDHDKTTYEDERPEESMSFYANVDWDITDRMQLSLGGRLTTDKKKIRQLANVELTQYMAPLLNIPGVGPAPVVLSPAGAQSWPQIAPNLPPGLFLGFFSLEGTTFDQYREGITYPENKFGDDEWDEFTPSAKLSYRLSEETLIYAGWATGFKSGGFDYSGPDLMAATYEPELVTTWSVGTKSTLLDGTLRLNFEAFLNIYEDKQLTDVRLDAGGRLIQYNDNVGDVETSGAEIEILWLPPVEGLTINFNLGLLDVDLNELIVEASPNMFVDLTDISELGHAPEMTAQARIQYTMPVSRFGALTFGLDADYRDEMFTRSPVDVSSAFESQSKSEARTLTNAFVSFNTLDDRWRVSLEGKNLSDKRVLENTFKVNNFILGGYNRGRTWGLTVTYQM